MGSLFLLFVVFQAAAFGLVAATLVALDRSQRPVLCAFVALAVPWFFGGPGYHCEHYRLYGPLAELSRSPIDLHGWWLAFPWCFLVARWLVERVRPARPGASSVPVVLTWGVLATVVGYVGPSGDMGARPVVNLGWFMTVVLAYVGARGLVEQLLGGVRRRAFAQVAIALALSAAIAVPVEVFGTAAGLWAWRLQGAQESWVYGALAPGECPPFVPYPAADGALPFPLGDALAGWTLKHVLPPIALLTLLEGRIGSLVSLLGRLLLAVSPLLVVLAQLLLPRTAVDRGLVTATPEGLAALQWLANTALVAVAFVLLLRLANRGGETQPIRRVPLRAQVRDPLLLVQGLLGSVAVALVVLLAWRHDGERAGATLGLVLCGATLAGVTLVRRARDRRGRVDDGAAHDPPVLRRLAVPIPASALALCAGALACMVTCLGVALTRTSGGAYAWTVLPLAVATVATAIAAYRARRSAPARAAFVEAGARVHTPSPPRPRARTAPRLPPSGRVASGEVEPVTRSDRVHRALDRTRDRS